MSIEKNIERIADALEKIANHLNGEGTPKQTKATPKKPAVEKEESPKTTPKKVTVVSDVQDALVRVANEAGRDAARGVLAEFDGALKVGDLQESDFDACIKVCEKTLNEAVGA